MKDKIIEILALIPLDSRLRWAERWANHNKAADELTALMCYREVRAYCKGRSVFLKVPNLIVALFKDSYSKEDILKAVEQVKNEPS